MAYKSIWFVASIVILSCTTSCGHATVAAKRQFCAVMTDSVGLYAGNPVTQMGYKIGSVTSIEPRDTDVTVKFTIDSGRRVPQGVNAVTRSPSILADRALELVGNYEGGSQLQPDHCIPVNRSFTPQSISRMIGSATNFVNAINPDGSTNIADALTESTRQSEVTGSGQRALDQVVGAAGQSRPDDRRAWRDHQKHGGADVHAASEPRSAETNSAGHADHDPRHRHRSRRRR